MPLKPFVYSCSQQKFIEYMLCSWHSFRCLYASGISRLMRKIKKEGGVKQRRATGSFGGRNAILNRGERPH